MLGKNNLFSKVGAWTSSCRDGKKGGEATGRPPCAQTSSHGLGSRGSGEPPADFNSMMRSGPPHGTVTTVGGNWRLGEAKHPASGLGTPQAWVPLRSDLGVPPTSWPVAARAGGLASEWRSLWALTVCWPRASGCSSRGFPATLRAGAAIGTVCPLQTREQRQLGPCASVAVFPLSRTGSAGT